MSGSERLTITLPADMAATVRNAVASGEYLCASDVIYEALHAWKIRCAVQRLELTGLHAEIQKGIDDMEAGRTEPFDPERIIAHGRARMKEWKTSGKD